MDLTEQLAAALREALDTLDSIRDCAEYEAHEIVHDYRVGEGKNAIAVLARYDAEKSPA